ncbi:hypothetical protein V3C99_018814 [Haemonchus contortus]
MSGRTLVLLALFGALLGGVWYQFTKWKPSKPVQPQVLIAYAPFMNETKTAKAILKKLLATPQRVVSSFF